MLIELNIQEFAIIQKANICFSKGLNIITGETGTGKSIMVDALNLVLGGRSDKNYIKDGSDKTIVEALFFIDDKTRIKKILDEYGIDVEKDNNILITREIHTSGRSISRVNGRTVTLSMLSNLTKRLIDIQGQHEHQSLLSSDEHIRFVDLLGSKELNIYKEKVKKLYMELLKVRKRLKELSKNEMERERTIDLLKFQVEEIEEMDLRVDEEEQLIKDHKLLSNSQELSILVGEINDQLSLSDYSNNSIIDEIRNISRTLGKITEYDEEFKVHEQILESVCYSLEDVSREISDYGNNIEFDSGRLNEVENRLSMLSNLKRKYGNTIEEILSYKEKVLEELRILINLDEEIEKINIEIRSKEESLTEYCDKLTEERKKISLNLEQKMMSELEELNMDNSLFKVKIEKLNHFTELGKDKVEFFISTNVGQELKPMSKIASGGEISRIMLAFKNILAEVDNINSLIFDEIDSGISGRTAQIVGEKILQISTKHQVICITHLPQIASMADTHFMINKALNEDKKTLTSIVKLKESERVNEICRLIGGVYVTDTTKKHAQEMIELSKKQKKLIT